MGEEFIICPQCRIALTLAENSWMSRHIRCPSCEYEFKPEDESSCIIADQQRQEAAAAHAQKAELVEERLKSASRG